MCGLRYSAGSAAEMSGVHCGVSDLMDRSKRGDVRRDTPASNTDDLVLCLGAFAGRPVRSDMVLLGVGVTVKTPCLDAVPPKVDRTLATKRSKSSALT